MKERVYDLLPVLNDRMKLATTEAQKIKKIKCDHVLNFVHIGDKEFINPKHISFEDQLKIIGFVNFVKEHPDIDTRTIKEIFALGRGFTILKEVYKLIPNFIEECLNHDDEKYIPYLYFGLKQNQHNEHKVNV